MPNCDTEYNPCAVFRPARFRRGQDPSRSPGSMAPERDAAMTRRSGSAYLARAVRVGFSWRQGTIPLATYGARGGMAASKADAPRRQLAGIPGDSLT